MLINNVTHQRETFTEWPIRLPLTVEITLSCRECANHKNVIYSNPSTLNFSSFEMNLALSLKYFIHIHYFLFDLDTFIKLSYISFKAL